MIKELWQNYKRKYSLKRIRSSLKEMGIDISTISDVKLEEIITESNQSPAKMAVAFDYLEKRANGKIE